MKEDTLAALNDEKHIPQKERRFLEELGWREERDSVPTSSEMIPKKAIAIYC